MQYLIGMAAAQLSKTGTIGYVASFPVNVVYCDLLALMLGARSINPDMKAKVLVFNSWFDPPKAAQAANALVDAGADFLIAGHDDPATLEVAEKRKVWCSAWNADMRKFGPNAYVSSVELNWKDFYTREVKSLLDGTWKGNRFELLPLGEGVDRDDWGDKVPQDVRQKVDAVRDKMLNEDFFPFVGPIKDNKGKIRVADGVRMTDTQLYQEMNWAIEGVEGL